jgi:hypothetical protein
MWPAAEPADRSERVRIHDAAVHHHQASLAKVANDKLYRNAIINAWRRICCLKIG